MTVKEMKELALHAAKRTAPTEFTVSNVDAALADAFKSMTGSVNDFMRNKYDIYEIISETADQIVPPAVMAQFAPFAEIQQVAQGQQIIFKRGQSLGRARAKKFLTQVGLSGVYETFRLDTETWTMSTKSIGGAVTIDFERVLDGAENLAELMQIIADAQVDGIYAEVQNALMSAATNTRMPAANKVVGSYSAASLAKIVNTVKVYGGSATILASPEFVAAMGPDAIVPALASAQAIYSPDDIESIHTTGRIHIFRGTPVVELRQSFLDENNAQVMINPQYAYILPSGTEKVVKIGMEGNTQMYDFTNRDQSVEVNTYRKIGVGLDAFNNWGIYKNSDIDASNWYNDDYLELDVDYHKSL